MTIAELISSIDTLLGQKEDRKLRNLLARTSAADIAQLLTRLPNGKRKTFALLPPEVQSEVVLRLNDETRELIVPRLSDLTIARFLHFNEEDDAADILQILATERRDGILKHLKPDRRLRIEKLLHFHPESAGGLMDLNFITVQGTSTKREVAEQVQHYMLEHRKQIPMVVVMDDQGKPRGFIPHRSLMLAPATTPIAALVQPLLSLPHSADQEHVLKIATREKGDVFGVVDDRGKFLGVIHTRDLLKIAQMEATEDVYKFAGVSSEEHMLGPISDAVRMRYRWLIINLGTAFLAASVVSLFEGTIGRLAILAAFMPIVAGMGGNAGTQALAVTVRGLAVTGVSAKQRMYLLGKESVAGLVNGLINGVIVAAVVLVLGYPLQLAIILGASMVINLVVAGFFGALIPVVLKSMKIDPAVASSVFVTTATDITGFLVFLGLAATFL